MKVRPALSAVLLSVLTGCAPPGSAARPASAAPVASAAHSADSLPSAGAVVATIPVADHATAMAFDGRYLWVCGEGGAVSEVDTTIGQVIRTIKLGGRLTDIAVTPEGVWVADAAAGTVTHLDLGSGQPGAPIRVGAGPVGFVQANRELWVFSDSEKKARVIDPRAAKVVRTITLPGAAGGNPAVAFGAIWMPDRNGADSAVWRIDPASGEVTDRVSTGTHPVEVAFGFGVGWVTHDDGISRFDVVGLKELARVTGVGRQVGSMAATLDSLWVTSAGDNRLTKVDPSTNDPVASLQVCTRPQHLMVVGNDIWVVCHDAGALIRVHPS